MKIIIKITKEEALDAWRRVNPHLSRGNSTRVELEDCGCSNHEIEPHGGGTGWGGGGGGPAIYGGAGGGDGTNMSVCGQCGETIIFNEKHTCKI